MIRRSAWAVVDQGVFAGAHLFLSIALARSLTAEAYGVFAMVYSILVLCSIFHTAFVTEPLAVIGADGALARNAQYRSMLLKHSFIISIKLSMLLLIVGFVATLWIGGQLGLSLVSLAVSLPLIFPFWLLRRVFYLDQGPHVAAAVSLIYLFTLIGLMVAVERFVEISPPTAFLIVAFCSLLAGVIAYALLRRTALSNIGEIDSVALRKRGSNFGRWAVCTGLVSWIPANGFYFILPLMHGLDSAGVFRAIMNLAAPAIQGFTAIAVALVPTFAGAGSGRAFRRLTTRAYVMCGVGGFVLFIALGYFGDQIVWLLYANAYSNAVTSIHVWIVSSIAIFCAVGAVANSILRAQESFRFVFYSHFVGASGVFTVGVLLAQYFDALGAVIAVVVGYGLVAGVSLYFSVSKRSKLFALRSPKSVD